MHDNLEFEHAFDIEVQVGKCSEETTDLDRQTKKLNFPIVGGTIKTINTEETFAPHITSTSIKGTDEATLSDKDKILHLNVTAKALIDHKMGSVHEIGSTSMMQLKWTGAVNIGKDEESILRGNFKGDTQWGNPMASFRLEGQSEQLAGLKNRTFIGQGRFRSDKEGLRIFYHVIELTQAGGYSDLEIMELLKNEEF